MWRQTKVTAWRNLEGPITGLKLLSSLTADCVLQVSGRATKAISITNKKLCCGRGTMQHTSQYTLESRTYRVALFA